MAAHSPNEQPFKTLRVHFRDIEAAVRLGEKMGQPITEATRELWFKPELCKGAKVMKKKKMTAQEREQQKKKHEAKLDAFAKRARILHSQTKKGETSALKLGKLLLTVRKYYKDHHLYGGLTKWIQGNIGKSESTRNRCNYALRLANGKHAQREDTRVEEVITISKALSALAKLAKLGKVLEARKEHAIIVNAADVLLKKAELAAKKENVSQEEHVTEVGKAAAVGAQ
jgi:hypothetical protein